jgi:hypothetical protein
MMKRRPKANRQAPKTSTYANKANRLKAEIEELQHSLFNIEATDPQLRYENLKTFRAEIMRTFVLSLHLAIEDLLHAILFDFLARHNRRLTKRETIRIVDEMRSADLIHWCARLNLVTSAQYRNLLELNRIRNACAHNWILDLPRSRRIGQKGMRKRIKVPIVVYKGGNLLTKKMFTDEFCPVYSGLYLNLLLRVWKMQGKL